MSLAAGVGRSVAFKKQAAVKTIAPAGAGGSSKYFRRTSFDGSPQKDSFQSAEILTSMQVRDMRHGRRFASGQLNAELSAGGYQQQFEAVLRAAAAAQVTTGALTNVTAASTSGAAGTYTRAAGSFLTDGFKIGDVINWTGWATTGVPNNNHYAMITALTSTVMTVLNLNGVAVGPKASGDSVTGVTVGKKVSIPASGHTRDYFTLEDWHSDASASKVFKDAVFTGFNLNMQPNGMATVQFPFMALDFVIGTAQYFTSPAAAPTGGIAAGVNGALIVNGAAVGIVTGLTCNVNGNYAAPGGVVGNNTDPDIFPGTLTVGGEMSVLLQDTTWLDYFDDETEISIACALRTGGAANADVICVVMPRVKISGVSSDDVQTGITMTVPYTALENTAGGAGVNSLNTTISVQDSAFV